MYYDSSKGVWYVYDAENERYITHGDLKEADDSNMKAKEQNISTTSTDHGNATEIKNAESNESPPLKTGTHSGEATRVHDNSGPIKTLETDFPDDGEHSTPVLKPARSLRRIPVSGSRGIGGILYKGIWAPSG